MPVENVNSAFYSEAIKAQLLLLRFSETMKSEARERLKVLEKRLAALIYEYDPTAPNRRDNQLRRLKLLTDKANVEIKKTIAFIEKQSKKSYIGYGSIEGQRVTNTNNTLIGFKYVKKSLTKKQVTEITKNTLIDGKTIKEVFADQSVAMQKKFKAEASQYLREYQLSGRGGAAGTAMLDRMKEPGGVLVFSKKTVDAISQTVLASTAEDVRRASNDMVSNIVKYIQWISTLDGNTSAICRALDGKLWTIDLRPVGHKFDFRSGAPRHFRCRSTTAIVTKPIEELGGIDPRFNDLSEKQRAAFGKPVSQNVTFNEWLKGRPPEEQKEMLGKKRWALWKNNNLSVSDMVNQSDRQITLVELEKLIKSGKIGN